MGPVAGARPGLAKDMRALQQAKRLVEMARRKGLLGRRRFRRIGHSSARGRLHRESGLHVQGPADPASSSR